MTQSTQRHAYIVVGATAPPLVILLDASASLAYLARTTIETDSTSLVQRTFGEPYTHAWPAFDHDVLVALTGIAGVPYCESVRGLAAALLLQREVPVVSGPNPFAMLLTQASLTPKGRTIEEAPQAPPVPKERKAPAKPAKHSALQSLMGAL